MFLKVQPHQLVLQSHKFKRPNSSSFIYSRYFLIISSISQIPKSIRKSRIFNSKLKQQTQERNRKSKNWKKKVKNKQPRTFYNRKSNLCWKERERDLTDLTRAVLSTSRYFSRQLYSSSLLLSTSLSLSDVTPFL